MIAEDEAARAARARGPRERGVDAGRPAARRLPCGPATRSTVGIAGPGSAERSGFGLEQQRRRGSRRGAARRTRRRSCAARPGCARRRASIVDRRGVEVRAPHLERAERERARRLALAPDRERHRVVVARTRTRAPGRSTRCTWRKSRSRSSTSPQRRRSRARGRSSRRAGRRGRRRRPRATRRAPRPRRRACGRARAARPSGRPRSRARPGGPARSRSSPLRDPRSSTRLPSTSPHRRRSASVGPSGPYTTVSGMPSTSAAAPAPRSDPTPRCSCGAVLARLSRMRSRFVMSAFWPAETSTRRRRTPRPSGAPRRRGTAPAATS